MSFTLFDYQEDLHRGNIAAWEAGHKNVLDCSPTGSGKTVLFTHEMAQVDAPSLAIAHRQELVGQMSLALARNDVYHRINAPKSTVNNIIKLHIDEFGKSYYKPNSWQTVSGVRTLISRKNELSQYLKSLKLWIIDEAHHVVESNEWGRAVELMPETANGLLVTATPLRADGIGLGRGHGGVVDHMVMGPTMRDLINRGRLTDYKIYLPPQSIQLAHDRDNIGKTGDFKQNKLKQAASESKIVGDVVEHYLKLAPGQRGVTFVTDLETAAKVSAKFNAAGVPAEVVSAKTPDLIRANILRRFKNGDLLQLVNVDLFGEGFDLPAISVVSMARPTMSWALFVQQFGRALRKLEGKDRAIIIDHVGNTVTLAQMYGMPDTFNDYSLAGTKSGSGGGGDGIPLRACLNPECMLAYERFYKSCPYCGHTPVPADRSEPEFVDGDLIELDPATIAKLTGGKEAIDRPLGTIEEEAARYHWDLSAKHMPVKFQNHAVAKFKEKFPQMKQEHEADQMAQSALRESIAWWAGYQRALGRDDHESYRRFYHAFGIDVLSAQGLKSNEALQLADKVNYKLGAYANG